MQIYKNIIGDDTIFIKDEKLRNPFANFIVFNDENLFNFSDNLILRG